MQSIQAELGYYDRSPLAEGDILCITAGPYPENLGKLLRYRSGDAELITAVVMDEALTYCDGFSRHMECSEGEVILISQEHVTVVA